ncbi:BTAD domain-containing putative transcriptional regulator, partial [Glycomyces dulcitolivorans]|uniref:BTAD domain-containing putative transcriptional regulator n=1 Tax=Glycomyces dulcitolivorans TaxID=2200759 RepID=UPI000DD3103D
RRALHDGDHAAAAAAFREGLALWRGPAFAGLDVPALRGRARALDELRCDVLEACIGAEMECRDAPEALAELEALVADHPLREEPWRLLMLGLYRAGRQAEALEAYRRLFRVLDEELGVRPSPSIEELHRRILAGEAAQPKRTAPVVPRQLPAAAPYFTGRRAQVVELDALLHDGAAVALLTGTAGIGKTTLAVQWAHRVADRFPDGQLYANLRGYDPAGRPTEPAEVLHGFITALGAPQETIPDGLDARAGLYRTLTANLRLLVVLDNARGVEQVLPLLPSAPRATALVTSRNRLSGLIAHGAAPVPLPVLAADEAARFMETRLREPRTAAEPQAVRDIVAACAGLPLALAIAAARAAADPHFPLAELAAQMRDAGDRLDALADPDQAADLRAVFSWSYRSLTPDAARLFRRLSLHPGPELPTAAAAAAAGAPPRQTSRLLTELTRAHLLAEPRPGRFTFHDLLRAYAAELSETEDPQADRTATVRRILDFYLHSAYAAHRLIEPARDRIDLVPVSDDVQPAAVAEVPAALAWFDTEGPTLTAAVRFAADWGLDEHCWQLAWTLRDHLGRGRRPELAAVMAQGLAAAERLDDAPTRTRLGIILAQTLTHLGRIDEARANLDRSLTLSRDLGDAAMQAHAHHVHARISMSEGRTADAIASGRRALDLFRTAGHLGGQSHALNSIGWWQATTGELPAALRHCEEALALAVKIGDRIGQADTADSLGHIHMLMNNHTEAVAYCREAVDVYRSLGETRAEALTRVKLGDVHCAAGDPDAARADWQHALDLFTALKLDALAAEPRTKLDALPTG